MSWTWGIGYLRAVHWPNRDCVVFAFRARLPHGLSFRESGSKVVPREVQKRAGEKGSVEKTRMDRLGNALNVLLFLAGSKRAAAPTFEGRRRQDRRVPSFINQNL